MIRPAGSTDSTPSMAFWSYAIPFVNWYLPYKHMKEMWDKTAPADEADDYRDLLIWWMFFVSSGFISSIHSLMVRPPRRLRVHVVRPYRAWSGASGRRVVGGGQATGTRGGCPATACRGSAMEGPRGASDSAWSVARGVEGASGRAWCPCSAGDFPSWRSGGLGWSERWVAAVLPRKDSFEDAPGRASWWSRGVLEGLRRGEMPGKASRSHAAGG